MNKEKIKRIFNLPIITLGLLNYMLCYYICINLYSINYREEFAAMIIGIIFIGIILGIFYGIIMMWKEKKEKSIEKSILCPYCKKQISETSYIRHLYNFHGIDIKKP